MTEIDWAARYASGETPWDLGDAHPELLALLEADGLGRRRLGHGVRAVVPGCGRGHDALALARSGWIVTALDSVRDLEPVLGPRLAAYGSRFLVTNALDYLAEPPYELLWEHTFFCALRPDQRPRYGEMARRLLGYRGRLYALVFPADKSVEEGGPPWRTTAADLAEALGEAFALRSDRPVEHGVARRAWEERIAVFERLDVD